jgi:hypothetical protein
MSGTTNRARHITGKHQIRGLQSTTLYRLQLETRESSYLNGFYLGIRKFLINPTSRAQCP